MDHGVDEFRRHKLGSVDVVALAENHPTFLHGVWGTGAVLGLAAQYLIARRQENDQNRREPRPKPQPQPQGGLFWWSRGQRSYRKAG